jgi:hypothetical protein
VWRNGPIFEGELRQLPDALPPSIYKRAQWHKSYPCVFPRMHRWNVLRTWNAHARSESEIGESKRHSSVRRARASDHHWHIADFSNRHSPNLSGMHNCA